MSEPTSYAVIYQVVMGGVGGIGLVLLNGIRQEIRELRKRLEDKVDKADCERDRANCFPASLSKHSHTGLPPDSRVIGDAR